MKRQVEKRHGPRVDIPLEAWIYIKDRPPLRAVTKNISRDGMLLDTAQAAVTDTRVVDIVFTDIVAASAVRTRGLVIHSSPSGTGVMLRHALPPALFKHASESRAAAEQTPLPMACGLRR
jgi:hypothetical protein